MARKTVELDRDQCAEIARTCACFNFRKASRSVTQMFDQALAPTGLRSTQLVILIAAYVLECGAAQLARELIMDRSTLARNLRPLAQQGLLRLATARGRSRVVELTPRGKFALLKAIPYWEKAQGALAQRLGDRLPKMFEDLSAVVQATR
jgi:DNA-binding MarR family transcriptional regulator